MVVFFDEAQNLIFFTVLKETLTFSHKGTSARKITQLRFYEVFVRFYESISYMH